MRILAGAILVLAAGIALAGGAIAGALGPQGEGAAFVSMASGILVGLTGLGIVVREVRVGWKEGPPPGGDRPPPI
jgi:hypothetical protein